MNNASELSMWAENIDANVLQRAAVRSVERALKIVPFVDADQSALDRLASQPLQGFFFELASAHQVEITPGIWAFYMALLTHRWGEKERDTALMLPELRELYPSSGDRSMNELLNGVAEALSALAWVADEVEYEATLTGRLVESFYRLANAVERLGDSDNAYDLAAFAIAFGADQDAFREEIVRYALSLAITADRMHQIAVCSTQLAAAVAASADSAAERRLEAFDCCETALERLALAPEGFREITASQLVDVVGRRDYLRKLLLPLLLFIPLDERPSDVPKMLGFSEWPERVSTRPHKDWLNALHALWTAQAWDLELDKARLSLEPMPRSDTAHADWITWTIDHAAYRRAVPHYRSFLREMDFDSHFLVLSHEITHVLSLIGGIGTALTSLRVAAIDTEITLWSLIPGAEHGDLQQRIIRDGVAPLVDGNAGSLFRVEQSIELILKAQILQDVWTPWLEGLAIFGEIAADPALDPIGIGLVTTCLRNLLDFNPYEAGSSPEEEKIRAAYEKFAAEFESRCSAAITRRAPSRLSAYCRTSEVPYLAGFLAIRSIVSAWRATTGRPLTGTEVFGLLLHATRHGTFDAVPDLSLRSDIFAEAALNTMCNWSCLLAQLTREEIEDFLTWPQRDGPGRSYWWDGGHLVRMTSEHSAAPSEQLDVFERRVREALSSLTRPEDVERLSGRDNFTRALLAESAEVMRRYAEDSAERYSKWVVNLMDMGSLLPVGHAAAKFFVNIDSAAPTSYLATQIRTTEAHASDGSPSFNGFWFPIDHAGGQLIADAFRRLGNPRIEVTRVIDLAGVFLPERRFPGTHVLAFSYGDWFEIRAPVQAVDAMLDEDADHRTHIRNLVRARLQPDPLVRAEREVISRGKRGAERTRDWIARSSSWSIDDYLVPVEHWVEHVRVLTERVLAEDERRPRQRAAARALITTLMADEELANDLVGIDFETLIEYPSERRQEFVDVLFRTAQTSRADAATTDIIMAFAPSSLRIFLKGPHGWDVRSAVRQNK